MLRKLRYTTYFIFLMKIEMKSHQTSYFDIWMQIVHTHDYFLFILLLILLFHSFSSEVIHFVFFLIIMYWIFSLNIGWYKMILYWAFLHREIVFPDSSLLPWSWFLISDFWKLFSYLDQKHKFWNNTFYNFLCGNVFNLTRFLW